MYSSWGPTKKKTVGQVSCGRPTSSRSLWTYHGKLYSDGSSSMLWVALELLSRFQVNHNYSDIVLSTLLQCEPHKIISSGLCSRISGFITPITQWWCDTIVLVPHLDLPTRNFACLFIRHYIPQSITCKNEAVVIFRPRKDCNFWFWNDEWFQIPVPCNKCFQVQVSKRWWKLDKC